MEEPSFTLKDKYEKGYLPSFRDVPAKAMPIGTA